MNIENPNIIFDTINNGILILDENFNILFWNRWLEHRTKIESDRIVGTNICKNFKNINEKILKRKIKSALALNTSSFYSVNPHNYLIDIKLNNITDKVYESMQQSVTIVPYDLDKKQVCIYIYDNTQLSTTNYRLSLTLQELEGYKNDLEEKVKLEVRLNQEKDKLLTEQSKLAAMGEMIEAIAHQWRQPLNALSGHIQFLEDDYKEQIVDDKYIRNFIEKNIGFINFMSNTIDDFRNFFRIDKTKLLFSVRDKTKQTIKIIQAGLDSRNIKIKINNNDFITFGFPNEFQQVILNILNNAKDAIIETQLEQGKIKIDIEKDGIIKIFNNAKAIDESIINRIFEPYFTTKDEGKGTGIGLYMSKKIIENNMKGNLSVYNTKDGVVFQIKLNTEGKV